MSIAFNSTLDRATVKAGFSPASPSPRRGALGGMCRALGRLATTAPQPDVLRGIAMQYQRAGRHLEAVAMRDAAERLSAPSERAM